MADLFAAFEDLSPQRRASLKASSWELVGEELNTAEGNIGPASPNKKVTIVGNGEGDDGVFDPEFAGIKLSSKGDADELTTVLTTGNKSDTFVGVGTDFGVQVYNGSALITGGGNDTINGEGISEETNGFGVSVTVNSSIQTGTGNDSINGVGGRRGVSVGGEESQEEGSLIDTGTGNDSITGSSETGVGIYVGAEGEIRTGAGNDTVDALIGGFAGSFSGGGTISLGADNDTLIGDGFDSGIEFYGDGFLGDGEVAGTEDKIVLDNGTYTYSEDGSNPSLTNDSGDEMNIINFELISGINGTIDQFDNEYQNGEAALVSGQYEVVDGFLIV